MQNPSSIRVGKESYVVRNRLEAHHHKTPILWTFQRHPIGSYLVRNPLGIFPVGSRKERKFDSFLFAVEKVHESPAIDSVAVPPSGNKRNSDVLWSPVFHRSPGNLALV
jgi:hypothetical protein